MMDSLAITGAFCPAIPELPRDQPVPFWPGVSHSGNKWDYLINWANYLVEHQNQPEASIAA